VAKARRRKQGGSRCLLFAGPNGLGKNKAKDLNRNPKLAARVERALLRAGESAQRTARMYGTPLYFWENGRVVAKHP